MIYKSINSEQFFKANSLILAFSHKCVAFLLSKSRAQAIWTYIYSAPARLVLE
jgi:hypothetical protein